MGRIMSKVSVQNALETDRAITFDALVDTGASYLTLPVAWKDRLGKFGNE